MAKIHSKKKVGNICIRIHGGRSERDARLVDQINTAVELEGARDVTALARDILEEGVNEIIQKHQTGTDTDQLAEAG